MSNVLLAVLLSIGCTSPTPEEGKDSDSPSEAQDRDADGYALDDCDDGNSTVHPNAEESCDNLDNDCNGQVDEGLAATWYIDRDGDGFGDPTTGTLTCTPSAGSVNDGTDCDDGSAVVNPESPEICDGLDNNCDDDADGDAIDQGTWYLDADGDGFGDPATSQQACLAPSGHVAEGTDCNDHDAAFHPAASENCSTPVDYNCDGQVAFADADLDGTPACQDCDDTNAAQRPGAIEVCNGLDDDCDGGIDLGATDASPWYGDADGDGHGDAQNITAACTAPTGAVTTADDCNDHSATTFPGAVEHCDGVDEDCDGTADNSAVDAGVYYTDNDGDGSGDPSTAYISCTPGLADAGDCDDQLATVHPGAIETCDGLDEDCDGQPDNDAADIALWYSDLDGDGFGDATTGTLACAAAAGQVSDATDCDDSAVDVSPAATEHCDGRDENCDGNTDNGSIDAPSWFADTDGDGFGNPASSIAACTAPPSFVADTTDCDDSNAARAPGAAESCDGLDNDCNGSIDDNAVDAPFWFTDSDADGYGDPTTGVAACTAPAGTIALGTDCDDGKPAIYPGATEICDSSDNNCDGMVDEDSAVDALTWYEDHDVDGYGDVNLPVLACELPLGAVADSTDCDDTNPDIFVGATEYCNNIDDDCNGSIDEASALDALTWFRDVDGDGFGGSSTTQVSCSQPAGYASTNTDCDDARALSYPGAPEYCNGRDDNCNGTTDESSAVDALTWYRDADSDSYGSSSSSTPACTRPSGYVSNSSDCDDTRLSTNPAAAESCNGRDDDCDGTTDENTATNAPTWYADTDGDGYGNANSSQRACTQPAGYVSSSTDCADTDAARSPAATELCNGIDDDCDGTTDESSASNASTWYADTDGDGYGSTSSSQRACSQPTHYVSSNTDCDDSDSAISPIAIDFCDNIDNDCSGLVDDNIPPQYLDDDGDGFGDSSTDYYYCGLQPGFVYDNADDCDDEDWEIHPYAFEVTNDHIDNDCDGYIDSADPQTLTTVSLGDDAGTLINLTAAFPFCGSSYSSLYMQSNGRLTFGSNDTAHIETAAEFANDISIAPLWDDMNPTSGSPTLGYVRHSNATAFYWRSLREYGSSNTNTFAAVLFDDGRVLMDWGAVAARDGLAGWSCGSGGSLTEQNLTLNYVFRDEGAWGLGDGQDNYTYEIFTSNDNDLDYYQIRFCTNVGTDADGDGWDYACGDMDDHNPDIYPGNGM